MGREIIQPQALTDESLMPNGKHKDLKMIDVPAKHLLYIYENDMCKPQVKLYIEANLEVIKQQAKLE